MKQNDGPSTAAHRINWILDKVGFVVIGFFAVKTYDRLEAVIALYHSLDKQVQMHGLEIQALKSIAGIH